MMLWLLALVGLAIFGLDWLSLEHGFNQLTHTMSFDKRRAEIGELIGVTSTLENKKWLAISYLRVNEEFPLGFSVRNYVYSVFILPFQRIKRHYRIYAEARGLYTTEMVKMELGNFSGFDSRHVMVPSRQMVTIWPKAVDLDQELRPYGSTMGDFSVKRWILEDPLFTVGIREYTGNEPQRYIHWPSSARYGELMVRNFDFTTEQRAMVILNAETMKPCFKPYEADLIEYGISLTRSVLESCEGSRLPYGFASNAFNAHAAGEKGFFNYPSTGAYHLETQLDILGAMAYTGVQLFDRTLRDIIRRQGDFSTAIIISPRILDTYVEPLNALARVVQKLIVIAVYPEFVDQLSDRIQVLVGTVPSVGSTPDEAS